MFNLGEQNNLSHLILLHFHSCPIFLVMSIDRVFNSLADYLDFIQFYGMMVLPLSSRSLFHALSKKIMGFGNLLVLHFDPI